MLSGLVAPVAVDVFLDDEEPSERADAIWTATRDAAHRRLTVRRHHEPAPMEREAPDTGGLRPAAVFFDADGADSGTRLLGVPAGYIYQTVVGQLLDLSRPRRPLADRWHPVLELVDRPLLVQVAVSANCPYCPHAIRLAERLAAATAGRVRALIVDAAAVGAPTDGGLSGAEWLPSVRVWDPASGRAAAWAGMAPESEWISQWLRVLAPEPGGISRP